MGEIEGAMEVGFGVGRRVGLGVGFGETRKPGGALDNGDLVGAPVELGSRLRLGSMLIDGS